MKPKVYGGLAQDAKYFSEHQLYPSGGCHYTGTNPIVALGGLFLPFGIFTAEISCTAAADTVTLPITMWLDPEWPPPPDESIADGAEAPAKEEPKGDSALTPGELFTNPAAFLGREDSSPDMLIPAGYPPPPN
jgi:hypothetical protein